MEFGDDDVTVRVLICDAESVVRIPPNGVPLVEVERQAITQALRLCGWCQKDAAELLHITARVLNYKVKGLGIPLQSRRLVAMANDEIRKSRKMQKKSQDRVTATINIPGHR